MEAGPLLRSMTAASAFAAALAGSFHTAGAQSVHERGAGEGVAVADYEISLDLPDSGRTIEARAVLLVRRASAAETLVLDLVRMHVDSVLVEGAPSPFATDSMTLRVPLPRLSARADSLHVAIRYHGTPADGLVISTDSLGRWRAFGDNWPDRARMWIPSIDRPRAKATVTWIVRAPSTLRVVANGKLIEERALVESPGRTLTRWRSDRPIPPYLMVIAAAQLVAYDLGETACGGREGGGCVHQTVYVAREVGGFLPGPFRHAADIVQYFAALVGPFPYEKLAHVESSTRYGGMENASAIFYADAPFRKRTMQAGVIAHETAHQWFGDAVTPREFGHLWLSEGFATYFEQLWWRHREGEASFVARMGRLRAGIVAAPEVAARPVVDTAQTRYMALLNANSYAKGGWVLHMLRTMVGDSIFFAGVRAYVADHRHGTAVTDDLQQEMERAAGKPLGWFFDQWLRRPGYAELAVEWRHDPRTQRVTLEVRQGSRFGAYRCTLAVRIDEAEGRTRRGRIEVPADSVATIVLPGRFVTRPRRITPDPDTQLLATISAAPSIRSRADRPISSKSLNRVP